VLELATTLDVTKCLQQLCTDNIGGILLVTKVAEAGGVGIPFLTILATPLVTTFSALTGDIGVVNP
jgi:hypothetical protein